MTIGEQGNQRASGATRNKRMRALILGIGLLPVALGVLVALGILFGLVPWRIESALSSPDYRSPPQALDLPWISGWIGWALVLLCVGCTAWTIWRERGQAQRMEPLALAALCLAALGHAEAVRGAKVMASTGSWPVNLIDVAIWMLLASAAVGLLAWVRLLLSKDPTRGRVFATCAILCSLSSAWIVHTFLVDCWETPFNEDGIELPVIGTYRTFLSPGRSSRGENSWPELLIAEDGPLGDISLGDVARSMPQKDGLPDGVLVIRADRRAPWRFVQQAIESAKAEGIWKISFYARWEEPSTLQSASCYFRIGDFEEHQALPKHTLRVTEEGAFLPGDLGRVDRASMLEWVSQLEEHWTAGDTLRVAPTDEASWGSVLEVMTLVKFPGAFERVQLGPFQPDWF